MIWIFTTGNSYRNEYLNILEKTHLMTLHFPRFPQKNFIFPYELIIRDQKIKLWYSDADLHRFKNYKINEDNKNKEPLDAVLILFSDWGDSNLFEIFKIAARRIKSMDVDDNINPIIILFQSNQKIDKSIDKGLIIDQLSQLYDNFVYYKLPEKLDIDLYINYLINYIEKYIIDHNGICTDIF